VTNVLDLTVAEQRIAERVDLNKAGNIAVSSAAGGIQFTDASQMMEFAKLMAIGQVSVPKYLRGNAGACLAIIVQATEWRMSPYAVANKSYSVNDRIAYESQLVQAVVLQRAPIKGRFEVEFTGEAEARVCKVTARLRDGGTVDYTSPPFGKITPKNSPLWKADPDQQHFYFSARSLCRRHFPDVLLGVYAEDELERGPDKARDITPSALASRFAAPADNATGFSIHHVEAETATTAPDDPMPSEHESLLEYAYRLGVGARAIGRAESEIPKHYGAEGREEERAAWLNGFRGEPLVEEAEIDAH
jgi:hypothetical protein